MYVKVNMMIDYIIQTGRKVEKSRLHTGTRANETAMLHMV